MSIYRLTEGDKKIFQKYKETGNPNWITSYYLKSESTGTWWNPDALSDKWKNGYEAIRQHWISIGRPNKFEFLGNEKRTYLVVEGYNRNHPRFHDHHGFLFQPWQLELFHSKARVNTIVGGYGCGKTLGGITSMLVDSITLPGYRGLVLAPNATQVGEIFEQAMSLMYETEYLKRFLVKAVEKPHPLIVFSNDYVGESKIQFFPIGDAKGVKKVLTLTVDEVLIDQSEQLFNIQEIVRVVGSRMRGTYRGRPRKGKMTFLANADDNPALWEQYDEAEKNPRRYFSLSPKTSDNPFITDQQLLDIMEDVGGDKESIRVHMEGGRPITGGAHFSREALELLRSPILDAEMARLIESGKTTNYEYETANKVGVVSWRLPPVKGHRYLVVADPGYGNPPKRNAPVIGVWDYTDFPSTPARLIGFHWVYGNNSPWPWIEKYTSLVKLYNAETSNAIDDTGMQSFYTRVVSELSAVNATGMSLAGQYKFGYLNIAKSIMNRGLLQSPSISGVFTQLSRYEIEDKEMPQDIVMMFLIAVGWLESQFFISSYRGEAQSPVENSRYDRRIDRVEKTARSLSARGVSARYAHLRKVERLSKPYYDD